MKLTKTHKTLAAAFTVALTAIGFTAHAENIPGVAEQPASYFYTGKPYDTDLGEYTFAFRNYSPQINRWTSADPSGFPDGANQNRYASIPTKGFDKTGLSDAIIWKDSTPTSNTSAGNLGIQIQTAFKVDTNLQPFMKLNWVAPQGINGWVVQRVTITWDIKDDSTNETLQPIGLDGQATDYFEAWRWQNNAWSGNSGTDTYKSAMPIDSHGYFQWQGQADFYTDSMVAASSPSGWSGGNTVNIPSGDLPAVTAEPAWWGGTGITHNASFGWE